MGMKTTLILWQATDETIEAFAAVLSSRWSAARSHPGGALFWPTTTNWLRQQARRLTDKAVSWELLSPVTTAPAEASSSSKPRGPRRC